MNDKYNIYLVPLEYFATIDVCSALRTKLTYLFQFNVEFMSSAHNKWEMKCISPSFQDVDMKHQKKTNENIK